jgi:hypothetical protein
LENDSQWDALVAFTREEIGLPWFGKEPALTRSTRVLDDLGIDGDDAFEFMENFFDRFEVANAEDFPMPRYFYDEGNAIAVLLAVPILVIMLVRFVFRLPPVKPNPDEPALTLGMLHEAIRVGRWDTEAIERSQESEESKPTDSLTSWDI